MKLLSIVVLSALMANSFASTLECSSKNRSDLEYHLITIDLQGNDLEIITATNDIPLELASEKGVMRASRIIELKEYLDGRIQVKAVSRLTDSLMSVAPINETELTGELVIATKKGETLQVLKVLCELK
ncbi:hypothetical protein M899_0599 [Bacteriovorax sp. BSW11_IV]|uniref:hypothetical protein n=1 Tax=Bacteriovorax sp. BSW11_IV TaxID=1353529 RepID=UPI00038A4411|nr:hypothetical protein [Bacteriovorax sp. BSW11_IV]EQC48867.1 hypothetical protein M899_0599 [Bacteriovorax sp. BSW11_IV]